jgi:hypothetical protein
MVRLAIFNLSNGPGMRPDPNYQRQLTATQQTGIGVLGYVRTLNDDGTRRTVDDVKADIDLYIRPDWYRGIKGIFLDQVTRTAPTPKPAASTRRCPCTSAGGPGRCW